MSRVFSVRPMAGDESTNPAPGRLEYHYDRAACARWSVFGFFMAAVCVALAVVDPTARFAGGIVPGWLFGTGGALVLGGFGFSWLVRGLSKGPALVLDEEGIRADRRLGGPGAPPIDGLIPWSEVDRVERGKHGSIVLHLRDPSSYWAGQSLLTRIRSFNLAGTLSLGGNDLDADPAEITAVITTRSDWTRIAPSHGSDETPRDNSDHRSPQ